MANATKRIMILATNGFEQSELENPKQSLEQAGFETVVVSPESGKIRGWDQKDWGNEVPVDMTLEQASADDFDALLLPGGQINPDVLRMENKAVRLVRDFNQAGKPIAAICHGPWMLVEAGILRGKTVTSWKSIRTDLKNAGANVVDEEVAIHGNLITSRCPDDLPAFNEALMNALQSEKVAEPA